MALSLNNISYGGKSRKNVGTLRITENGIGWKNKQGKSISLVKDKIDHLEWIIAGKGKGQLRIYTTEGSYHIYDGIPPQELAKIEETSTTLFNKDIEHVNQTTLGWNWGEPQFNGSFMNFLVNGKRAFDIPLSIVEQAHHDKNDVVIGFPQDSSTSIEGAETMLEMRLWVPNTEDDISKPSSAESVLTSVLEKADVLSAKGSGIVTFSQVVAKTPRGRYDLDIFSNFLRMKGTQSSTITYDCITRITELHTVDEKDRILIISLDPPLRRGHTSYPHILMQFPAEQALSIELDLTEEQLRKFDGKLQAEMSGNKFDLILQVFRVITGIKATKLGNFESIGESSAVRCSLKAHDGYLYPLAKCFIFIYNPITLIPFESIAHVEFARLQGTQTSRTFDLVIFMKKTRQGTDKNYIFNSINKDEHQLLETYLRSRGVTVTGTAEKQNVIDPSSLLAGIEEESEDDDFSGAEEESDDLEYDDGGAVPIDPDVLAAPGSDDEDEVDDVIQVDDSPKPVESTKKRKKKPSTSGSPSRKKSKV